MHGFGRLNDVIEIVNTNIKTQVTHCEHKYQSTGCKVRTQILKQGLQSVNTHIETQLAKCEHKMCGVQSPCPG